MPGSDSSNELNPAHPAFTKKLNELEAKKKAANPMDQILAMLQELKADVAQIPMLKDEINAIKGGQEYLMKQAKGKAPMEEEAREINPPTSVQVSVPNQVSFSSQDVRFTPPLATAEVPISTH